MTLYQEAKFLALISKLQERTNQLKGLAALYSGTISEVLSTIAIAQEVVIREMYKTLDTSGAPLFLERKRPEARI